MQANGRLDRGDGVELAWEMLSGSGPTVVFLPGFRSDMQGAKALALREFCAARRQSLLRLDYSGHGASGGAFTDGTIGIWASDALQVIEARTNGPLILVGSSMGGWIGVLLARQLGSRVVGFIGIAAAPDFVETMVWPTLTDEQRYLLDTEGRYSLPSQYGAPLVITRALIEDGRRQSVLGAPIAITAPVRLLQGQQDPDVPWRTALTLAETLESTDVQVVLIKDGDHRLSRPGDLALLTRMLETLLRENGP